jgi:hypothetical protein
VAALSLVAVLYMLYQGSSLAVLDSERTGRLALAALAGLAVMVVAAVFLADVAGVVGIAVAKVAGYAVLAGATVAGSSRVLRWPAPAWLALAVAAVATVASAAGGATTGIGVALVLLVGGAVIAPRVLRTLRG